MENTQALEAFLATIREIEDITSEIMSETDDHFGYAPDDIDWSHVGTANTFRDKLREALDTLRPTV